MSWTLDIRNPIRSTLLGTATDTTPNGVQAGFETVEDNYGAAKSLKFRANNSVLGVPNRGIVTLTVDGNIWFEGVAIETPSTRDPRVGDFDVVPTSELLSRRIIDDTLYEKMDIGAIVRALITKHGHPGMRYDPTLVPDTGRLLTFQQPFLRLDKAIKVLADSYREGLPMPFGSLADGRFFFQDLPAGTVALNYASLARNGLEWLSLRGDETVTYATLLCLTSPSGDKGAVSMSDKSVYRAGTLTKTAVGSQHDTYRAATAAIPPAGADLLTYGGLAFSSTGFTINPANASDADPATYATLAPGNRIFGLQYGSATQRIIGFRLVYEWISQPPMPPMNTGVQLQLGDPGSVDHPATLALWPISATIAGVRELIAVLPPDAHSIALNAAGEQTWPSYLSLQLSEADVSATGQFKIYTFVPISIDESKALALASSLLRNPAGLAGEVTVPSYVAAATHISIPDAPGGAVTVDAVEFARSHTQQGLHTTVIRFGRTGDSATAYGLRLAAQQQAGSVSTDVRAHLERP